MEPAVLEIFKDMSGRKSVLEVDYLALPPEKGRVGVQRQKYFYKINFLKNWKLTNF